MATRKPYDVTEAMATHLETLRGVAGTLRLLENKLTTDECPDDNASVLGQDVAAVLRLLSRDVDREAGVLDGLTERGGA